MSKTFPINTEQNGNMMTAGAEGPTVNLGVDGPIDQGKVFGLRMNCAVTVLPPEPGNNWVN